MKTEEIKVLEGEVDAAIENCIKLQKHFPKAPKKRTIIFDLKEMLKRKRIKQTLVDAAIEIIKNRNIQINDSSVHGSIVCTIDLNSVALTLDQTQSIIS